MFTSVHQDIRIAIQNFYVHDSKINTVVVIVAAAGIPWFLVIGGKG